MADITELPTKVSYALRFPERPRLNALVGFLAGVSWRTDVLFPTLDEAGPRERFSADGGNDPGKLTFNFFFGLTKKYTQSN